MTTRLTEYLKLSGLVLIATLALSNLGYTAYQTFLQYAEDTVHVSGDLLTMMGVVRQDSDAALAGDGDRSVAQVDANGYVKANVKTSALPSGAATSANQTTEQGYVDGLEALIGTTNTNLTTIDGRVDGLEGGIGASADAAATVGSTGTLSAKQRLMTTIQDAIQTSVQLIDDAIYASDGAISKVIGIGCQFDDTSPGTTTENNVRPARCSTLRELYGVIRDAAGNGRGANVNASNELTTSANTELPAAITYAAGMAFPTAPMVIAANACSNGTTLDPCVKATAGAGTTDANTQRVTLASDSTGNIATIGTSVTPGGGAAHLGKAEDAGHTSGDTGVMMLSVRQDTATQLAGSADDYNPITTDAEGRVHVSAAPAATSKVTNTGTTHYLTSAASTNSTNVKASAGNLYSIIAVNTTATLYYLRLYNASSAPTCSSATNFVNTIPIPAATTGAGIVAPMHVGQAFATGISYCLTGGGSSTDNTNAATGVYVTMIYK